MSSVDASTQKDAKKKLVIFDAHSSELLDFKRKYQNHGYDVTAVLVVAPQHKALRDDDFKPKGPAIDRALADTDPNNKSFPRNMAGADYLVTDSNEAVVLLKHLAPDCVLADENMRRATALRGSSGTELLKDLRAAVVAGTFVLHTSQDKTTPERLRVAKANDPASFAIVPKSSIQGSPADAVFRHVALTVLAGRTPRGGRS